VSEISILYEGEGILAVNKPRGISAQEELTDWVRAYLDGKTAPSLSFRPGPLHRLDRESSGVIVFGSSLSGARRFSELMRGGLLQKTYIALFEGILRGESLWRDTLRYSRPARKTLVSGESVPARDAKFAQTRVIPIDERGGFTAALVEIATGRRHQIRAQSAARGFPLYGDLKYGGKNPPPFFLHAGRLAFPDGSPFPPSISAPLPSDFRQKLKSLGLTLDARRCPAI
jgi:23S rRNA pseudouridine955/2504/2580 synthase